MAIDRLTPHGFIALARTIELPVVRAEEAMAHVAAAARAVIDLFSVPRFALGHESARRAHERAKVIVAERSAALIASGR